MDDDVLVPTDGRDEAGAALDRAFELASTYGATVHAPYVVDDSRGSSGLMGPYDGDSLEPLRDEGEAAVEAVAREAREADVAVTSAVRQHTLHEGIRPHAEDRDVDLIVTSSRGHSGISRAPFGSLTERVLRVTERPVSVVSRDRSKEPSQ